MDGTKLYLSLFWDQCEDVRALLACQTLQNYILKLSLRRLLGMFLSWTTAMKSFLSGFDLARRLAKESTRRIF